MKILVVGDIQGCFTEFQDLLDKAGISDSNQIVAVGDLVDSGPDSPAVLRFFTSTSNTRSVMGNHEWKHIHWHRGLTKPGLAQVITRRQFGEQAYLQALEFMTDHLPAYIELSEAIVAHGFFEPGVALARQKKEVLIGVKSGEEYIKKNYQWPWWEVYDGDKPLIVGHHDYSRRGEPTIYKDRVFCIDTGCCYGRALTGLILPEFKIISVPARADHWSQLKKQHVDLQTELPAE